MPIENYSEFPAGTTDDDIFDMLLMDIKAICCKCKTENIIPNEKETFKCSKCKTEQYVPYLNPKEWESRNV